MSSHADKRPHFTTWRSWDDVVAALEGAVSPHTTERLRQAYEFAAASHRGQVRPAGEPYVKHLLEVLEILIAGAGIRDERTLLTAILHDVVEDTDRTLAEVRSRFGDEIADLVEWLTKPDSEPEHASVVRRSYLNRFEQAPGAAVDVKLADRLSNVQRLDTHPSADKQRLYYRETIENIVPLTAQRPWFATQFAAWQRTFRHLEAPERTEP
jgi:guanosine-3',5'-bis(diphosphate) 3'-pyrophosphohydrolase